MQGQLEENNSNYQAKISTLRQETSEDKHNQIERIQNERDLWEQKFEQKRKQSKETEVQLNRENAELEKKLCLLQENFTRLDTEKRRQEADMVEKIAEYEA